MRQLLKTTLLIIAICFTAFAAAAQQPALSGTVVDAAGGGPIQFATVAVRPGGQSVATDDHGRFAIAGLKPGSYTLTVSFVGYKTATRTVNLGTASADVKITLTENSKVLNAVVVTAKESTGMTSSSRIGRDAMSHLQPTSFADLLELLPGNISQTPSMGQANTIALRETGTMGATGTKVSNNDYSISSLGTLFMVDGAPINGDANMQSIPQSGTDQSSPEYKRDITNKGVDMRTISTDNIESVEVVRGIPSVEYGNLTSGVVRIQRISSATPLTARFKADEYSKLFSVGKGLSVGEGRVLNADVSYLDSKVDPRNNFENYKRVTASVRYNLRSHSQSVFTRWNTGFDYTGSFDNSKTDPDLSQNKINDYQSRYNRMNYNSDISLAFKRINWLSYLSLNVSASYQHDRLDRRKQVAPSRASVAPTSMEAGVHDGQYLLREYVADFAVDGKPLNLFANLKAEGHFKPAKWLSLRHKLGAEWTFSKNYGGGQIYDITRPLSASWPTRPRAYKDVPSLQVLSFYAEENVGVAMGRWRLDAQAGVRSMQLPGLDSRYWLSGHVYLDPRVNVRLSAPAISLGGRELKLVLAGGYGLTTKMPTIAYLFPQVQYNDFVQLNYYDALNPLEHSRVSLRTYIDDVTNYQLRAARNRKWEVRLGGTLGGNSFSVTYFSERLTTGYRYSSVYHPYSYTLYDASGVDATTLTAPPDLASLPSRQVSVLDGYSRAANGSRISKQGVELTATTARWQAIGTALNVTGAWLRTTYSNSQMLFQTVSDVVDGSPVRNSFVGYYNTNDGRVNEQLSTNITFDTQIPRWGLIFTTSVQNVWYVSTTKLWQNGVPDFYLDVADGQLHPYTADSRTDKMLQFLVQTYNSELYRRQTTPMAMYVNLKATKKVGSHLRIAVFANRLIDYLPSYKSNGLTVRRSTNPYFGMELVFSL